MIDLATEAISATLTALRIVEENMLSDEATFDVVGDRVDVNLYNDDGSDRATIRLKIEVDNGRS